MSNVTPEEIVRLVANAWGVVLDAMRAPAPASDKPHPFAIPGYAARACAVLLIRKHTDAGCVAINRAIGMYRNQTTERQDRLVETFKRHAVRHMEVVWRIEVIERQIDDIHELRTAAVEPVLTARREGRQTNVVGFQ